VLIPADPQHFLTSEIGNQISAWITDICSAYQWRLGSISNRLEFVHFILHVPPGVSPVQAVEIIRQRSSEKIFSQFKELLPPAAQANFWSDELLIQSGPHPAASEDIRNLIRRARTRTETHPEG
jgi:REP element-mobilizing transposase RayT